MLRLRFVSILCATVVLAGCSAEPDAVSLAQPQYQAASAVPQAQNPAPAPDHIAHRPATQPFSAPASTGELPLWPPATSESPPAPANPAPAPTDSVPPFLPTEPFPATNPPPETALGPALSDLNPLRASTPDAAPTPAELAPPSFAPSIEALKDNPLRSSADAAPAPAPKTWLNHSRQFVAPGTRSTEPLGSGGLLPHAPAENTSPQAITPPPAPPSFAMPAPAPAPTSIDEPISEAPQLSAVPKSVPRIQSKSAPARLPRVPINPQAHAEWSARQQQPSSSLNPSGGSAPPEASPGEVIAPDVASPAAPGSSEPPAFEPPAFAPAVPKSSPAVVSPPAASDPTPFTFPETPPGPAAAAPEPSAAESPAQPGSAEPESAAETMPWEAAMLAPAPAAAASPPAPPAATTAMVQPATASDPYDVVRVFYGTDRMPELVNRDTLLLRVFRFLPAVILILLALFGVGVVLVSRKISWIVGTAALLFFSTLATWHGVAETVEIAQLAAEEEPRYSAEKSDRGRVERGICEVSIPKLHEPGEMESPSLLRFERKYDPAEHITLRKTVRLHNDAFYEQLQAQVASSPDRELLVFVHGFNVSFEDAARRTAQMAHDLKLQGAPVFFSWPADKYFLLTYGKDESSVGWSAPHLRDFLLDLVHNTDARAINLVAHSMGNRALTTALREIDLQLRDEARLFNQVVLAAPDIDADDFRDNIAPAVQRTAKQVTLYASSNDIALGASRLFHRNARAGDTSHGLVLVTGMHTIDVSNIDGGPWGHSYYGASDPVLRDLHLLLTSLPPERRTWLKMNELDGQAYWAFKPLGSTASPALMTPR